MKLATFKKGGIYPDENKFTASCGIKDMPLPLVAVVPLSQHIGAPAKAVVSKGERVRRGQMIATPGASVSAAVHAPVSGVVSAIDFMPMSNGYKSLSIIITADGDDHEADEESRHNVTVREDVDDLRREELLDIVRDSGVVGMGGAAFPAHVKMSPPDGSKAGLLIINASECEPYLTCDDALMRAYPEQVVRGVDLIRRIVGVGKAVIAIEANKPESMKAIGGALPEDGHIGLKPLKTKYPQGGEKQLIYAVTGKEVASGTLPISVGVIVHNVATAYSVYQAVVERTPVIERIVTVAGVGVDRPGNYRVAIGTPLSSLGIDAGKAGKIIAGGPMMGKAVVALDAPVVKGTSGLVAIGASAAERGNPVPCVRCGACVQACPMGLEPYLLSALSSRHLYDEARVHGIADCMECGCCSYICPSWRPLLDYIRVGKQQVRKSHRK